MNLTKMLIEGAFDYTVNTLATCLICLVLGVIALGLITVIVLAKIDDDEEEDDENDTHAP